MLLSSSAFSASSCCSLASAACRCPEDSGLCRRCSMRTDEPVLASPLPSFSCTVTRFSQDEQLIVGRRIVPGRNCVLALWCFTQTWCHVDLQAETQQLSLLPNTSSTRSPATTRVCGSTPTLDEQSLSMFFQQVCEFDSRLARCLPAAQPRLSPAHLPPSLAACSELCLPQQ